MKAPIQVTCAIALSLFIASSALAAPLGTGFTYQGQLFQNGSPIVGPVTLRFSLWDAAGSGSPPTGGTQIGVSQILVNVPVSNGQLTVLLNAGGEFGANAFTGDARWLQIEVCSNPTCTTPTALSPRQAITATPYASFAAGPWQTGGGNVYLPGGNVGIGFSTPGYPLSFPSSVGDKLALYSYVSHTGVPLLYGIGVQGQLLQLYTDLSTSDIAFGYGNSASFIERMRVKGTGNVGIGTTAPTQKLDVRGEIKMGPSGQYFASGGQEDIWMIRGGIDSFGSSTSGCCYSVNHAGTGVYDIVFNQSQVGPLVTTVTTKAAGYTASTVTIAGGVRVLIYRPDTSNFADCAFDFITMGQR